MLRRSCCGLLGTVLLLLSWPLRVWAWGCDGHEAIALIAEKHMTAHALAMANQVLRSAPIDPAVSRYCSSQGLDLITDSSTWADDVRGSHPETSAWHYIDIPRDAPRTALAVSCPVSTGCVTSALEQQRALLRNAGADARTRADALRFLLHLVGDVHQPLHCVSNNDLGGNCVPVNFFGNVPVEKNLQTESFTPNLHSIWDAAIIQRLRGASTVAQWAARLDEQFSASTGGWEREGVNQNNWAWESHQLADSVAYVRLPAAVPVEKPKLMKSCADDKHVSTRLLQLHEQVSQSYVDAVAPTIEEQIAKAGVRLAMLLNQIWP